MLTICLDESGNFRNSKRDNSFIGGVIYTGDDYQEEKERLDDFFAEISNRLDISYPQELHTTDNSEQKNQKIREAVIEYLKKSGKYHFIIKVNGSAKKVESESVSNSRDDNKGENLYENMLLETLENILFNNPVIASNQINLEICTRAVPLKTTDSRIEDYKKLYPHNKIAYNRFRFYVSGQQNIKTGINSLEEEYREEKEYNYHVDIANYKKPKQELTPYLYLADITCDLIKNNIDFNHSISGFEKMAEKITGNRLLLWVYDDLDLLWQQANQSFKEREIVNCLSNLYKIKESDSNYAEYYQKNWVSILEDGLLDGFDIEKMRSYIENLESVLITDLDYNRAIYIGQKLKSLIKKVEESSNQQIKDEEKYSLNDLLMRAFNHTGATNQPYYHECKEIVDLLKREGKLSPEEIIDNFTRAVQDKYANKFDFEGGIEALEEYHEYLENIVSFRKLEAERIGEQFANNSSIGSKRLGRVKSSLGQFYSFLGQKKRALKYFKEALQEFENDPFNYNISLSMLLHLALDQDDKELYQEYEHDFYGSSDLNQQLNNIINDEDKSRYHLYLYFKSLATIYSDQVTSELIKRSYTYKQDVFKLYQHPWELIYKQIALIYYQHKSDPEFYQITLDILVNDLKNENYTIKLINHFNELEFDRKEGATDKIDNKIEEIEAEIKESGKREEEVFADLFSATSREEKLKILDNKFTYMYR